MITHIPRSNIILMKSRGVVSGSMIEVRARAQKSEKEHKTKLPVASFVALFKRLFICNQFLSPLIVLFLMWFRG